MHTLSTNAHSMSLSSLEPLAVDTSTTGRVRIILGNEEKGQEAVERAVVAVQILRNVFSGVNVKSSRHAGRLAVELTKRHKRPFTAQELEAIKEFARPVFQAYGVARAELITDSRLRPAHSLYHLATLLIVELSSPITLLRKQLHWVRGTDEVWLANDDLGKVTRIEVSLTHPFIDCIPAALNKLAASCGIFIEEASVMPPCIACDEGHGIPV